MRGDSEESLLKAIRSLLVHPGGLSNMGLRARRYLEERPFEAAFYSTWRLFEDHAHRQGRELFFIIHPPPMALQVLEVCRAPALAALSAKYRRFSLEQQADL